MLLADKILKNNKSYDPLGIISEIFKPGVAGKGLLSGLISLMNTIKSAFIFPKFLEYADIYPIYKRKGSRMDLINERGIFISKSLKKNIR